MEKPYAGELHGAALFSGRSRQTERTDSGIRIHGRSPRIPQFLAIWYLVGERGTGGLMRNALSPLNKVLL